MVTQKPADNSGAESLAQNHRPAIVATMPSSNLAMKLREVSPMTTLTLSPKLSRPCAQLIRSSL